MRQPEQDTITIEDRTLRNGFTRIPNGVLRREGLSPGAKLAYMGLLSYAWQEGSCFPGQARLAQDLGIGQRSVIRYLKELQSVGLLKVQRRGLGKTNIYILPKDAGDAQSDAVTAKQRTSVRSQRGGSAKLADQELPKADIPEVPGWQREEDAVEEDTDPSKPRKVARRQKRKRGAQTDSGSQPIEAVGQYLKGRLPANAAASHAASASDREIVSAYMQSIALELRDQAPLRSTVTRLIRIYERSEVDSITAFVDVLYRAKATTLDHASSIRGGEPGARRIMPYYIAVVEDLVGLRVKDGPIKKR